MHGTFTTSGKIVAVIALRGDEEIGRYPTQILWDGKLITGNRQRLSPKKIRGIKHWFRYHHGKFEDRKNPETGKWERKEVAPYIRFKMERIFT